MDLEELDNFGLELEDVEREDDRHARVDWQDLDNDQKYEWLKDQADRLPFEVIVKGRLFVNKSVKWTAENEREYTHTVSLEKLDLAFSSKLDELGIETVEKRTAFVKALHSSATKEIVSLEDFGAEQSERLTAACKEEWSKWLRPLDVIVEVWVVTEAAGAKKRSREDDLLLPTPATQRRTRTTQQEAELPARVVAQQDSGNYGVLLHNRWQCTNAFCPNHHNFCWVNRAGIHYKILTLNTEKWSSAITAGEASVDKPPGDLVGYWYTEQGSVNDPKAVKQRKGGNNDDIKELMELQYQAAKIDFMAKQASKGVEHPQPQQSSAPQITFVQQAPPQYSAPPPLSPTPVVERVQSPVLVAGPLRSSPIDGDEDDEDLRDAFLDWLIQKTKREASKNKLADVKVIVQDCFWTLEQLKLMSDPSTPLFQTGVAMGIPDGIVRSFRSELTRFKAVYRSRKAASGLLSLHHG